MVNLWSINYNRMSKCRLNLPLQHLDNAVHILMCLKVLFVSPVGSPSLDDFLRLLGDLLRIQVMTDADMNDGLWSTPKYVFSNLKIGTGWSYLKFFHLYHLKCNGRSPTTASG
jgi:hypothetical protein